jgi:hypothetical protein
MMTVGSFIESVEPDITETIPSVISSRLGTPVYVKKGVKADVSIADLPFRFSLDDTTPYTRQTADFRRQQIDTSPEPGEQTLSQWWVRDQVSWHRGAGINFYEPGSQQGITEYRYDASNGVDVWTQGQATLLHSCSQLVSASAGQSAYATTAVVAGVNMVYGLVAGQLFKHDGTTRTNYTGSGTPSTEPVIAGSKVLSGSSTGILSGDLTGTALTTLWSTTGAVLRPWWVKGRVIAAQANVLYDLTIAGGGSALSTVTPLYTHPDPNWTWVAVCEAPAAIMVAGFSNGYSAIYQFVLTDAGTGITETLGSAVLISDFPPGEEVHAMKSYLSQYLGIGTTRGFRVGTMTSNYTVTGVNIAYGPLTIQTTKPVSAIGVRDNFFFCGIQEDIDGMSGCARIDISQPTDDTNSRYAWAYDAQSHTPGVINSVTLLGNTKQIILGVAGKGVYLQSSTAYEPTGYIRSGRIRYGTAEPKAFNLAKIRAQIPGGCEVQLTTVDNQGNNESIVTLGDAWNTDEDITLKTIADIPQAYAQILLTLVSDQVTPATPTLQDVQVKATPLPRIQRTIVYPLILEDVEQDSNGNKIGRRGGAADRLFALEDLEQGRSTIVVKDFTSGEIYNGQIRSIQFQRNTPPSRNRKNFGGIIQIEVLKL